MAKTQPVMVGMKHVSPSKQMTQYGLPCQTLPADVTKKPRQTRSVTQPPPCQTLQVTGALAKKTNPETLIFDNGGFQFGTNTKFQEPGALAVQDDIKNPFMTLCKDQGKGQGKGQGNGQRKGKATTPGSWPLAEACVEVLNGSLNGWIAPDTESIIDQVKEKHAAPIMYTSDDHQQFSLKPGLTIQASCQCGTCNELGVPVFDAAGFGNFGIIDDYDMKLCVHCGSILHADVLRFESCRWQVRHSFLGASRTVVRCDTGIRPSQADKSWYLERIDGYRTLDVHVLPP